MRTLPGTPTLLAAGHRLAERHRLRRPRKNQVGLRGGRRVLAAVDRLPTSPRAIAGRRGSRRRRCPSFAARPPSARARSRSRRRSRCRPARRISAPGFGRARIGRADHSRRRAGPAGAPRGRWRSAADSGERQSGGEQGQGDAWRSGYPLPTASAMLRHARAAARRSASPSAIRRARPGPFIDHRASRAGRGSRRRGSAPRRRRPRRSRRRRSAAGRRRSPRGNRAALERQRAQRRARQAARSRPRWRDLSGGRDMVVLATISASSRGRCAARTMRRDRRRSRSGATFRNTGGPPSAARRGDRSEQLVQRALVLQSAQARRVGRADVDRQIVGDAGHRARPPRHSRRCGRRCPCWRRC